MILPALVQIARRRIGYDFGPNGVWIMPAGATHPVLSQPAGQ
jgi:hypothetical protein